ncbi:protein TonB [Mesorhizobium sp. WSM1497]|nr:protein TonB [Mesorhizobium sp. WSM1497]
MSEDPDVPVVVPVPVLLLAVASLPVEPELPDVPVAVPEPVPVLAVVLLLVEPELPDVPVVVPEPVPLLAVILEQSERTCACCSEVREDQFRRISSCDRSLPELVSLKNEPESLLSQPLGIPLWPEPELIPDPVDEPEVPFVPLEVPEDCAKAAVARQREIAVAVKILRFM